MPTYIKNKEEAAEIEFLSCLDFNLLLFEAANSCLLIGLIFWLSTFSYFFV